MLIERLTPTMSQTVSNWTTNPPFLSSKFKPSYGNSKRIFIFFPQPATTTLFSPNLGLSCRSSVAAAVAPLTEVTHNVTLDDKNAKTAKFCKMGDLKKAMELLTGSKSLKLESNTYCSVLQLCAELKALEDGKRVHSFVNSNGMPIEGLLGVRLVFMYVTCGDLVEGRQVFDEILNENKVFLWNLMISEYAKIGDYRESLSLFNKMQELGVAGDSYTFTCVLNCLAALGNVRECKKVHGYIYKLGFGSCNSVVNSLIGAYFKCSGTESAHKLFDETSDRDAVSWSLIIRGCAKNGLPKTGLEFFIQMLVLGVDVDLATLVNVLVACANLCNLSIGRAIHGFGVKTRFCREVMFNSTLVDMYSKCGSLDDATDVFVKMGETTIVSWTSIIAAHVRKGLYDEAIGLFNEMQSKDLKPDIYTVTCVVHACACGNLLDKGRDVHNYIKKNNMVLNLPLCNALMNMYAKCGSMEEAHLVFSQTPVKDVVSWNTMIGGYSKNSLPNEALKHFVDMQKQSKQPDEITIACVLPACASLAALEKGREIHGYLLRKGYFSDLHVANALMDTYVKCGLLVLAQKLFHMIPKKDLISWTVMIAGYGMHGFGKEAISAFNKMRIAGIEPNEYSFTSILYACRHSGLLSEGWKFFNSMRSEYNIEAKLEHYTCMVDLLAHSGNLSKAYKFIETMSIEPDASTWAALLSWCRVHHDVKLAEKVAEHIFELEPRNTRYYVLLANVYTEAEKWEEVKKLQERIGKRRLKKKNPGCSWIEVRGRLNVFVAGDDSHPQARRIESFLEEMRREIWNEGWPNNMRNALIDEEEMEKKVVECGHSEMSAMAFGILNLSAGKTVRVTKNVRICGGCHEMGKFMSKTTRTEIVVRDPNWFHHFKDGSCSCRGLWKISW